MYLIGFLCNKKFSFEKLFFLNLNYFILLFFLPLNSILNNKFKLDHITIYSFKKNKLLFQFKNNYIYNNLIFYNNYFYLKLKYLENLFLILSEFGFLINFSFTNFIIFNFHISLLPKYKGLNPLIVLLFFVNRILGFNIFILSQKIDKGKNIFFYKLFLKFNFNYNIIKYNFSLINSLLFFKSYIYIFYKFFYFINNFNIFNFFIFLTR